jgi:hypothetical protein
MWLFFVSHQIDLTKKQARFVKKSVPARFGF